MEYSFLPMIELVDVHNQICKLEKHEAKLSAPKLTKQELIPLIFEWFCELSGCNKEKGKLTIDEKMQFLIIVLSLYSPLSLSGGRVVTGIRDRVAELFGYNSPSGVSNNMRNMMYMYEHYKNFREAVNTYYSVIMKRLDEMELIP